MTATVTPLTVGTDIGETIGGKVYSRSLLSDTAGADAMGLVTAAPAANTLLGRLKALVDALIGTGSVKTSIDAQAPADDIFTLALSDTVDLATIPKALLVLADGNLQVKGTGAAVTIAVKAGMIIPLRARRIYVANTTATVVGLA